MTWENRDHTQREGENGKLGSALIRSSPAGTSSRYNPFTRTDQHFQTCCCCICPSCPRVPVCLGPRLRLSLCNREQCVRRGRAGGELSPR